MAGRRRSSSQRPTETKAAKPWPSAERLTASTGNPLAGQQTASLGLDTAVRVEQDEVRIETRRLLHRRLH